MKVQLEGYTRDWETRWVRGMSRGGQRWGVEGAIYRGDVVGENGMQGRWV